MGADDPVFWFVGLALACVAAWAIGARLGKGPAWMGRWGIIVAVILILVWGWLVRHPATAVRLVPTHVLSRVEGVGGVPIFMLLMGIAWTRCVVPRQRHVVAWAFMFGVVYFIHGGRWLLQETPSAALAHGITGHAVMQSQDYSCVPAACATALNLLGVPTSEATMAELTLTRTGSGATIVRALDGLSLRLRGTGYTPLLIEPGWSQLRALPMPALTPLQFEPTRRHMVTLLRVDPNGVWLADPIEGHHYYPADIFLRFYRGQVIAFERR